MPPAAKFLARFLSTPSARRATWEITGNGQDGTLISIHALREEGDEELSLL